LIGICETTVEELKTASPFALELKNPEKTKKSGYKNSGSLILTKIKLSYTELPRPTPRHVEEVKQETTFLDYIKGGCTINMMVAIDFTMSNQPPGKEESLHYRKGPTPNQYQKAIRAIGDIIAPYDSDNMIPVYGFGAKVKEGQMARNEACHCFALTFNELKPEVKGVDGILETYKTCFKKLSLSFPTNFAEFITKCSKLANSPPVTQQSQHYNILLVLTDGDISDMPETLQAIKKATQTPLSIIIVGVGNDSFEKMKILDGDDVKAADFVRLCNC
jgi:hypothetical protein